MLGLSIVVSHVIRAGTRVASLATGCASRVPAKPVGCSGV
jgi:hypothetical protein